MSRRFVLLSMVALVSCGEKTPAKINHYQLKGVVKRLSPNNRIAVIQHETIKGEDGRVWMEAMTMEFPVRDAADFQKLRVDAPVEARVNQKESDFDYWLDQIVVPGQ